MDKAKWQKWVLQTATNYEDLKSVVQDTGIERLDRQHQRLIEYVLEMGEVIQFSGASSFDSGRLENQTQLFKRFMSSLEDHFKTESYFISRYNLAGIERQKDDHEVILDEYNRIFSDFKNGILSTFQTVRINLISIFVDHINRVDRETFLLEHFLPTLKNATKWEDVSEIIKSTGLPFMDSEHHTLTLRIIDFKNYMKGFDNKIRTKTQKEKVLEHLMGLFQYTETHFDHEEEFLKKYNLDLNKQTQAHHKFLNISWELIQDVKANRKTDLEEFIEFLFAWWVNHINGIDYVEFHFSRIAGPVFAKAKTGDDFNWLIRKTGIAQMDSEHAHLIGMLLKLIEKKEGKEKVNLEKELRLISKYVRQHFEHEEKIMEAQQLKDRDIHAEAHAKLLQYVEDAKAHAVSGRSQISQAFFKRMMRWWVEHTNGIDYDTFVLNRDPVREQRKVPGNA